MEWPYNNRIACWTVFEAGVAISGVVELAWINRSAKGE